MEIKPLLYLLFFILWLLYRQYSKAQGGQAADAAPKKSVWEEILEEMESPMDEPKTIVPPVKPKPPKKRPSPPVATYETLEDSGFSPTTFQQDAITDQAVIKEGEISSTEENRIEFDLRSAVIADVILNRKYQ